MLLEKHGVSRVFRTMCSKRYLSIAVQFCELGNGRKARQALRRAISLYPFDLRYYVYFLLSLMDPRAYRRIQHSKAKILGITARE